MFTIPTKTCPQHTPTSYIDMFSMFAATIGSWDHPQIKKVEVPWQHHIARLHWSYQIVEKVLQRLSGNVCRWNLWHLVPRSLGRLCSFARCKAKSENSAKARAGCFTRCTIWTLHGGEYITELPKKWRLDRLCEGYKGIVFWGLSFGRSKQRFLFPILLHFEWIYII